MLKVKKLKFIIFEKTKKQQRLFDGMNIEQTIDILFPCNS